MLSEGETSTNSKGSGKPKRMLEVPLEKRLSDTKRYCEKYPDLVPVVVTPARRSRYSNHHDFRYLFGKGMTIGAVCASFRTYLDLKPEEALFFTVKDIIPPISATLVEIYEAFKAEDNYLYFTYREEDVFGAPLTPLGNQTGRAFLGIT